MESNAAHPPPAPVFSIVAPVYNERELVREFCRRVIAAMEPVGEPFELILVDDGSRDGSSEIMREIHAADPRVKVLRFSRNFGHQVAITAGTDFARGQAVAVIDADLQDPPEVIPQMIAQWRQGYEVVYGVRAERQGETAFKLATASLFYRLIRRITNVDIPLDTGDFRLMDRKVVDVLVTLREHHRFMRGLSVWVGFRQLGLPYRRDARMAGETKYPLRKMLKFAVDGITAFSYLPLQLATYLGFAIAGVAALAIIVAVLLRLATGVSALEGQATTLVAVLFLGSIQLIVFGIFGEYLGRIYDEVKRRPLYIVGEALGLEHPGRRGA
ncbi:MAG: glycosyltransferase family 2 protein [Chloroflexi bacterium]|nr:glycosyltransferase family 2 protein [Chloroflexota bacterium]